MEQTTDQQDVIETPAPDTETVETPTEEELPEDRIARLEQEKAELESKNRKLYARLKSEDKKPEPTQMNDQGISNKDLLYLAKADIHEDDLDEVLEWAKYKKVPIAKAYDDLKPMLQARSEERRTAAATQTRGGQRGTAKLDPEGILAKAEKTGEVPESAEGMQALFVARRAARLK